MSAIDVIQRTKPWAVDICHVTQWLRLLPKNSVNQWVSSPPYYGLRSYLPDGHPDKQFEIGTEDTPEEYVEKMVELFNYAKEALHPSGSLYLNLGDTYANDPRTTPTNGTSTCEGTPNIGMPPKRWRESSYSLKKKDLIGVPWRVAFALQADGWYLRQWMPWVKRNPMTESVDDRPSSGCESIFLLSKSPDYFYDHVAIRREDSGKRQGNVLGFERPERVSQSGRGSHVNWEPGGGRSFRNTDLWFDAVGALLNDEGDCLGMDATVGNYPGPHFAVFPKGLIEPLILAGSSERGVCPRCYAPWEREVERDRVPTRPGVNSKIGRRTTHEESPYTGHNGSVGNRDPQRHITIFKTVGWRSGCGCGTIPVPAIVGDMFAGTGTTLAVAREHGRYAIGCDLDDRNLEFVKGRMSEVAPSIMTQFLGSELESS